MRRIALLSLCLLVLSVPASEVAAARERFGALAGPVRLIPKGSETLRLEGLHDYFGTLEIRSAGDGLVAVNRLPLERYLLGLNEVPTRWPEEALNAQAIAARTYALWTLAQPRGGAAATYGFDICASVQCQVFAGADVLQEASDGERWAEAVSATRGRAVLYEGEPILARYHSTSGGETFANEVIFPSEGPFPYLKGVPSTEESSSPLYRWFVSFTRKDLQKILRRSGLVPREVGKVQEVSTVPSNRGLHYPDVVVRGTRGIRRVTAEELRSTVRTLAPQLFPKKYPSFAPTQSGRLPEVFPSNRLDIDTVGRKVSVFGRGWGHGVGMSQYGAEGMARAGAGAEEILTHYYTDVEVADVDTGGPIEVGVAWGLGSVAITGDARIVDGRGRTVVRNALGTWRFRPAGPGAVSVRPPKGFGLPLEVGIVDAPGEIGPGERAGLTIALSRPARVQVHGRGDEPGRGKLYSAGRRTVRWRAPDAPGTYEVQVAAAAGRQRGRDTVSIAVAEPAPTPTPQQAAARDRGSSEPPWAVIAAGLLLAGAAALVARKVTMRT